ncbi:MAG: class I SAM-dependent methyltransferase [Myxococcales bacterium]|nr:class I SAM-dependent methyltransferase [Myxococcales bacterium]
MAAEEAEERFGPEITDLLIRYDPDTLERGRVRRDVVVDFFEQTGNRQAARIARKLPADSAGYYEEPEIDALFVEVHTELQRLHEEFLHGERLLNLLRPLVEALVASGVDALRVVDVGCGTGFVVRWLAACAGFDEGVSLTGCDYNRALIEAANEAKRAEGLRCDFVIGNAFRLREPAHIYLSMGVVHHFRGPDLEAFFEQQCGRETLAFIHFDIAPTWLAPLGAWLFHVARMRTAIARHDGVLSALRAHSDETLLGAARRAARGHAAPGHQLETALYAVPSRWLPITRIVRPVVGIRTEYKDAWMDRMGERARLFEEFA